MGKGGSIWQGDRMTGRQVGEEVRSLAVKWLMRLNLWQGDWITRRQVMMLDSWQ